LGNKGKERKHRYEKRKGSPRGRRGKFLMNASHKKKCWGCQPIAETKKENSGGEEGLREKKEEVTREWQIVAKKGS